MDGEITEQAESLPGAPLDMAMLPALIEQSLDALPTGSVRSRTLALPEPRAPRSIADVLVRPLTAAAINPDGEPLMGRLIPTEILVSAAELEDPDGFHGALRTGAVATDRYAFYRSPEHLPAELVPRLPPSANTRLDDAANSWGLFLDAGGIETIARGLLDNARTPLHPLQAIRDAAGFLIAHEAFHTHAWTVHRSITRTAPHRTSDRPRQPRCQCIPYCHQEEALAEAWALRHMRRGHSGQIVETRLNVLGAPQPAPIDVDDLFRIHRDRVANGLPGYRKGVDLVEDDAFHTALEALIEHWWPNAPLWAAGLWDTDQHGWRIYENPIWIYGDDDSAYARGEWDLSPAP